jgi:glycosyltransferase involved in cell wall biosynthesis
VNYQIAIFSYNRGPYLRNCVESVQRHCPGVPFTVYDDGSDEPELVEYLQGLGASVRHMQAANTSRHGGFYTNMQAALDEATANGLLLLQDDVQVVRDVTESDVQAWSAYWGQHPDCAFLNPVFMKGGRRADFLSYYQPDAQERVYHWVEDPANPSKDGPVPRFYMDVCLLNVQRLKAAAWQYHISEFLNGQQAGACFAHGMPQLPEPFVFYVPEEPVYRERIKTKGTAMAERLAGQAVKRFVSMSPAEVERFRARDLSDYPFAEDFIHTQDPTVQRPYRFNVYRTHWLARLVNKLEKLWTR